jgi:CheY-like chemotaxis protein
VEEPVRPPGPAVVAGVRVLVVDDDVDFLESLEVALRGRGAVVKTATSVQSALTALDAWAPDVLISDLGMPDEDGYALIRAVRTAGSTVPAIALTAYAADHDRQRSLEAGYQRHVGKPADPNAIIEAIADLAPPNARG